MNIVVFGANGPTGQILTKQALAKGYVVTAVTRHPETFPLRHEHLQVMRGDVFDLASVEQAVAGQDAVLSTLGVPFSRQPITVYSQGMAHIVQAMNHSGVRRLVCVSSSATDPQTRYHHTGGGFIFEKMKHPYAECIPPGQIWQTACSNNSPLTSICARRWQHSRCSPTCLSLWGERRSSERPN